VAAKVSAADVAVGLELPGLEVPLQRVNLIMYIGVSGDFNPIHWNERIAKMVGLPNVIAHGMLTMAEAGRVVTNWVGDPGAVVSYSVRFSKPVVVPDDDEGATLHFSGKVVEIDEDGEATVELLATSIGPDGAEVEVLQNARAVVQLRS
jgi:acyl dehydratase